MRRDRAAALRAGLTGRCVGHGTAAQVHRWLREKPVSRPVRRAE
jgi:hypothetical protein